LSAKSKIEWTDTTWNPVTGCIKVSAGCQNCYAERDWRRLSANPNTVYFGRSFTDVSEHPERLTQPFAWKKPRRILVNSMSDLFQEWVSESFIKSVFSAMHQADWHTYQVLTKRPRRMADMIDRLSRPIQPGEPPDIEIGRHIWLGVSVENQETADARIPALLATAAPVRFLSVEPLIEQVTLNPWLLAEHGRRHIGAKPGIHWVIVGGEPGPRARPMSVEWVRLIRDQCVAAGVPFFFKQWGEFNERGERVGKKAAGRLLDGREWNEYPSLSNEDH